MRSVHSTTKRSTVVVSKSTKPKIVPRKTVAVTVAVTVAAALAAAVAADAGNSPESAGPLEAHGFA
jgi:hypothetical protein